MSSVLDMSSSLLACLTNLAKTGILWDIPHMIREEPRLTVTEKDATTTSLGQYLASIRQDRKMTLRDAEEATGKEVSNAYLSQIENDKIKKPSPNILLALSKVYKISYETLMSKAGYAVSAKNTKSRSSTRSTFAEHNISPAEEEKLLEYLQFIRSRK
tara:strand:+ start:344 stop:817 length:474 start_codon:yes stop_codon:yes gene_type:complete